MSMDNFIYDEASDEAIPSSRSWDECKQSWPPMLENVGGYDVSTVFLVVDHSFQDAIPVLWETMVFEPGTRSDLYCERYKSSNRAKRGHRATVDWVKERIASGRPVNQYTDEDDADAN